jgi:HEAT repeat protein
MKTLAALRIDEAIPKLTELSSEGSFLVRCWAIFALGVIGGSSAVEHLIRLLDDTHPRARRLAAKALGNAGDAVATEPIRRAMRKDAWYRRNTYRKAIQALASRDRAG